MDFAELVTDGSSGYNGMKNLNHTASGLVITVELLFTTLGIYSGLAGIILRRYFQHGHYSHTFGKPCITAKGSAVPPYKTN